MVLLHTDLPTLPTEKIHINKIYVQILSDLCQQELRASQRKNLVQLLRHFAGKCLHLLLAGKCRQPLLPINLQNPRLKLQNAHDGASVMSAPNTATESQKTAQPTVSICAAMITPIAAKAKPTIAGSCRERRHLPER